MLSRKMLIFIAIIAGLVYFCRWQLMFQFSEELTLKMACRSFMREALYDPSSGQFFDLGTFDYKKEKDAYYVAGIVRAKNGFNALIMDEFWCKMHRGIGGEIILDDANIGLPPLRKPKQLNF